MLNFLRELDKSLLPVLGEALRKMGKAITLKRCRITMVIAAEEADQTAIRYGRANALLYTIYAFLSRHIRVKEFKAELRQDYLSGPEGESAEADLLVLVCPMILAGAGFRLLWKGGKIYLRFAK